MFQRQAARLVRDRWTDPNGLAEELRSMFDDSIALEHSGPLTIRKQNADADGVRIVNEAGGETFDVSGGRIDLGTADDTVFIKGEEYPPEGGATSVFLGKVVSGSGATYSVEIYENGSGQAATETVTATVPMIDSGEQIPADTWIGAVHKFTNSDVVTWEFQPPVWL